MPVIVNSHWFLKKSTLYSIHVFELTTRYRNSLKSVLMILFYHYQNGVKCRSPSSVANNCRIIATRWENNGKTVADKRVEKTKNKSGAMMSCSRGGCDSGANDRGSSSLKCSTSRRRPHSWHSSIGSPHHHRIKRMHGNWFKSIFVYLLFIWRNLIIILIWIFLWIWYYTEMWIG